MSSENRVYQAVRRTFSNHWVKALALNLLFLAISLLVFGSMHETNDEFTIAAIASGAYGESSPYLVFSNIIYGYFVTFLQSLVPAVNWYMVTQLVFCFVCAVILCYIFYEKYGGYVGTLVCVSLLFILSLNHYVLLQFSKNSAFISLVGFLMVLYALQKGRNNGWIAWGIFFACVGFMIRYNSFFVVACFLFFLCLIDLLVKQRFSFRREYLKKNLRYIVSFVILFACAAALFFVNSTAYNRDPEWKYFMEYSETRSDLLDYGLPKYYDHQEELEALGITSTDLVMLRGWCFNDPERFTLETLQELVEMQKEDKAQQRQEEGPLHRLVGFFNELGSKAVDLPVGRLTVFALVLFLLLCAPKNLWQLGAILLSTLMMYGYLYLIGRVIYRAEYGIWLCAAVLLAYCFDETRLHLKQLKRSVLRKLLVGYTVMLVVCNFTYLRNTWRSIDKQFEPNMEQIVSTMSEDLQHVYLLDVLTFNDIDNGYNPFAARPKGLFHNILFLGGWSTNAPYTLQVARQNGIVNPYREVIDSDRLLIVDNRRIDTKLRYIREHYCATARYELVDHIGGYNVYRIFSH